MIKQHRINLYLDADLMEVISENAKKSYLPIAAFIRQLLYVTLKTNENNKSINVNEDGK